MLNFQYSDDRERIFEQPENPDILPHEPPNIPERDDVNEVPPDHNEGDLFIGESEDEEPEEIRNMMENPEHEEHDDDEISQNTHDRPRRGNVYYNEDAFMKGRYIILETKPVDGDERDRAYECCLCQ